MGNHAAAKKIIALAHRPSETGRLSDDAIRQLVDSFYAKIRADSELGPIFDRAIPGDWGPVCTENLIRIGSAEGIA